MKRLTIALVAHDRRKADIVAWSLRNAKFLEKHLLICTGTTGLVLQKNFEQHGLEIEMIRMNSGPLGGDAQIAAMVVKKIIDMAVFLIDDLNAQPHEADIMMLLRQCRVHNVPIACNQHTADLMVTSHLWADVTYQPSEPTYVLSSHD